MLQKQYNYELQKKNSEIGNDGRAIEQTGKLLQVKDKYITIVFKVTFFREAKIAANRGGNRTGQGEL